MLRKALYDINKKIEWIEKRFIEEGIQADSHNKYSVKYSLEKREIESNLMKASRRRRTWKNA